MPTCTPGFTNSVNRWVHGRPVIVEEKMLMSIHCRAQSQKNRGNGLIFLANMFSKVTAMPRNGATVSGTTTMFESWCLPVGQQLAGPPFSSASLKLLANMCKC